jgi:SAM-dependent methyltransferase
VSAESLREKWDRFYSSSPSHELEPATVLAEYGHLLPNSGLALDLACGLGGNALFLARRGLRVTAWDISPVAIDRLEALAGRSALTIEADVRDVDLAPFPHEQFDVIVVSRFLIRSLAGAIVDSLKPGGLLFYQTFVREKLSPAGPSNPDYLLAENELLGLFGGLRVMVYREEGRIGDLSLGRRDEAYFVGQKR